MTDDLVKRLRDERHITQGQGLEALLNTTNAAADRIEQLEAALLDIFDHECMTSATSFIACTARDNLWPNKEGE